MVAYTVNSTAPPSTATAICFHYIYIYKYFVVLLAIFVSIMFALFATPEDITGRDAFFAVSYIA